MTDLELATTQDLIKELRSRPNTTFAIVYWQSRLDECIDARLAYSPHLKPEQAAEMFYDGCNFLSEI